MLYLNQTEYELERYIGSNPITNFKNVVSDFSNENQLITQLPRGSFNYNTNQYELLIMVTASDALGGITNITQTVSVAPNNAMTLLNKIVNLNNIFLQALALNPDKQIPILNLISLEITRLDEKGCNHTAQPCSGQGSCSSINDTQCVCNPGYHLKDCSADETVYTQYLSLKKSVYDQANNLKGNSTSQALNDQLIKSINLLLEGNDIGLVILPTELDSNLNDMDNVIQ